MIFATLYTIGVLANILFLVVIRDAFYDMGEFMRFLYPFIILSSFLPFFLWVIMAIVILVETVYSKKNGENQDKENKQ